MGLGDVTITVAMAGAAFVMPALARADVCSPDAASGETVTIAATEADNRIRLADGRLIQLAGVDPATLRLPPLAGREATLYGEGLPDRHGALHAALVIDGADLAADLAGSGKAIVRPHPGEQLCFDDLLAAEDRSRRDGLGLWREPEYAVADAAASEVVSRRADRFAIVSGKVEHVGETKDAVWIDFGKIWRTDVTIVVSKKAWPRFEAVGLTMDRIRGRVIRARGVVTLRSGPRLDIGEPAAIEVLETASTAP